MNGYEYPTPQRVSNKNTPVAHAANATLAASDMGSIHNNTGAGANITLTLPKASTVGGCAIRVQISAAQTVQLVPASGEKVYLGGSGVADKYCQIAGVIGNFADVHSDGVDWVIDGYSGVLVKQA